MDPATITPLFLGVSSPSLKSESKLKKYLELKDRFVAKSPTKPLVKPTAYPSYSTQKRFNARY